MKTNEQAMLDVFLCGFMAGVTSTLVAHDMSREYAVRAARQYVQLILDDPAMVAQLETPILIAAVRDDIDWETVPIGMSPVHPLTP